MPISSSTCAACRIRTGSPGSRRSPGAMRRSSNTWNAIRSSPACLPTSSASSSTGFPSSRAPIAAISRSPLVAPAVSIAPFISSNASPSPSVRSTHTFTPATRCSRRAHTANPPEADHWSVRPRTHATSSRLLHCAPPRSIAHAMTAEIPSPKPSRLAALRSALEQGSMRHSHRMINSLHPAELASLIESLPPARREIVWEFVDPELEGDVLIELNEEVRSELIGGMDAEELVAATEGMEVDDLADLIGDLPETLNQRVLQSMDAQDRERLSAVLAFSEDSAGGLMNTDAISVRPDVTLEVVLRYLRMRGELPDRTDRLFVVNRHDNYLGGLDLTRLITEDPEKTVGEVMDSTLEGISPETPARDVAKLFEDRDLV